MTPSVQLCLTAQRRDGLDAVIWSTWAYVARYGKQPLSELKVLSYSDLIRFSRELTKIVNEENGSREI